MSPSALRRISAVAGMTFREALRRKILWAAVAMTAGFLGLLSLAMYFAGRDIAQATAQGLPADRLAGAGLVYASLYPAGLMLGLIAVFASVGTLSGEVDSGVLYGVLARPVSRRELVLGKFVGLALMLCAYSVLLMGSIVTIARLLLHAPINDLWGALALFALEPLVLLAFATLGSSRLPTLANGVMCVVAYGIAFMGGVIELIGLGIRSRTMQSLGILSSLLMPTDAIHRMAGSRLLPGAVTGVFQQVAEQSGGSATTPSVWMVVWALGYVAVLVWWATRVFAKRDL